MANTARLGESQLHCLKTLKAQTYWAPGRWVWANYSTTLRIMEGLRRRGLVKNVGQAAGSRKERYDLTDEGLAFLAARALPKVPQEDLDQALLSLALDGCGEWSPDSGYWIKSAEYMKLCLRVLTANGYAVETSKNHWGITGGKGFDRARELGYDEQAALRADWDEE